MNFILLQQKDIFSQYFSGLQFPTLALVLIAIFVLYKVGKSNGWF